MSEAYGEERELREKGRSMRTLRAGLTTLVAATLLLVALPGIAGADPGSTTVKTPVGSITVPVPGTTCILGSVCVGGTVSAKPSR
jgi:hypothetical protein